jgi:hypothetical protein
MNLTRVNRSRSKTPSILVLLSLLFSIVHRPAVAGNIDPGIFELDGNAVHDSATSPPDDWANLYNGGGAPGGSAFQFTGIINDTNDGVVSSGIFTGGGSKDVNDVSKWAATAGSPPDKDNITHAYAAAYIAPAGDPLAGHLLVFFGADRFDNSGDAQIGFWFFQKRVTPGKPFGGTHNDGDILVVSNFVNGGATSNIEVYKWSAGSLVQIGSGVSNGTAVCNDSTGAIPANSACAVTNPNDGTLSPWPYLSKSGTTTFPKVTFFEGGIDLTAFGLGSECISTFLAETRSSQSSTATLKDFAIGSFNTCGIKLTSECGTASLNPSGDSVTFNFDGTVCNLGPTSVGNVSVTSSPTASITQSGTTLTAKGTTGECISYGGTYSAAALSSDPTVTATASAGSTTVSDTSSPASACSFDITPAMTVTKQCSFEVKSDLLQVDFGGTVCNQGAEKLINVFVIENGTAITPSSTTLAPHGQSGDCASYAGTPFHPGVSTTDPTTVTSTDTVTAGGQGALTGKSACDAGSLPACATPSATATCYLCP